MAKKTQPPPDYVLQWFSEYNNWAQKKGWQYLPSRKAIGMYWTTSRLISEWEQKWPTWEELDEGLEAFARWKKGRQFSLPSLFWFLASKIVDEDSKTKYPNILLVRDWGRSKDTGLDIDVGRCPRSV